MVVRQATKEVYHGYLPKRLGQQRINSPIKPWHKVYGRPKLTIHPKPILPEWTESPLYPAFDKVTLADPGKRERLKWFESLKNIEIADKKFKQIIERPLAIDAAIFSNITAYNSLPFVQSITRTNLIKNLPACYEGFEEEVNQVQDFLLSSLCYNQCNQTIQVQDIMDRTRRLLCDSPLDRCQRDLDTRIGSWWWNSKIPPPLKGDHPWESTYDEHLDEEGNVNQLLQVFLKSAVNYRGKKMLKPFVDSNHEFVTNTNFIPKYTAPLKYYGAEYKDIIPVMVPGFWNEVTPEFDCPHTIFLTTECLENRHNQLSPNLSNDDEDCMTSNAMMAAFGWLNGVAGNQGFTPYQEVTYPFSCQIITTDGQRWMFSVYQMNTHTFHRDLDKRDANNVMWTSGLMDLRSKGGPEETESINQDVIRLLIKFMKYNETFTPETMRPYLGKDTRSEIERYLDLKDMKRKYANMMNTFVYKHTRVALWEKIFFRSPETINNDIRKGTKKPFHVDFKKGKALLK